jgi:nitrite reductase/ring-hydroxylating ferredoxin subunit
MVGMSAPLSRFRYCGMDSDGAPLTFAIDPDAPVGTILSTNSGNLRLVLVRHAMGWSAAVDDCPHAGCSLSGMGEVFDGTVLICNCHGSEFDLLTGAVLRDPAEEPLEMFNVEPSADGRRLAIGVRRSTPG